MENLRVIVTGVGGPEAVQVVGGLLPLPGPGAVRIQVEAAGLSQADCTIHFEAQDFLSYFLPRHLL